LRARPALRPPSFRDVPAMPRSVDIRQAEDRRDVIHQAVHALCEGGIVGFPTETVYLAAAHALHKDAVLRLSRLVASAFAGREEGAEGSGASTKSAAGDDRASEGH